MSYVTFGTRGIRPRERMLFQTSSKARKEVIVTATAQLSGLSAIDRCDRCGAQAYVRVELSGDAELLFCAHHAREHEDKLREVAINIHDETGKLADVPAIAPLDEI
jgi:hypothetical protein